MGKFKMADSKVLTQVLTQVYALSFKELHIPLDAEIIVQNLKKKIVFVQTC